MNDKDREDFGIMKSDIKHTKEDISEIRKNSDAVKEKVDKLTIHLIGDNEAGVTGWIRKVTRFDYRLTMMERAFIIVTGLFTSTAMYLIFVKNILDLL